MSQREEFCVSPNVSIRDAIAAIDRVGLGIVLVVDEEARLLDTITDGDVRRAMLKGINLNTPVGKMGARRRGSPLVRPVTAPVGSTVEELITLMRDARLRHMPLVDADNRVIDLVALDGLLPTQPLLLQAVVMAGGPGTRLRPLTEDTPKPMLPVGGRPVMEHIIQQLQTAGIRHVSVTTHYQPEKIKQHFGDGKAFGVDLHYVNEDRPLGTAGALGLMAAPDVTQLVINGDIMTQVDFRAMLAFHKEHRADLTVAVRRYEVEVPYGVIESEGALVRALREKPSVSFFVNAGIYLLEPCVYSHIPSDQRFDMTDLIQALIDRRLPVVSFPIREYWVDIGQHDDYLRAQRDAVTGAGATPEVRQ